MSWLDRLSDWWWEGHSSTHHSREEPDLEAMKRNIKRLRRAGRDDLADQAQARVDEYEREAQQWRQDTYARKLPIIHADGNVEE